MKIAIMQPYLFPYIGYWQLLNSVDKFVLLDDVNFIMKGYINRNSILINGESKRFSIPLSHASQNKLICDSKLNFSKGDRAKFLNTIRMAYKRSPFFDCAYPIIERIIENDTDDLTDFIFNSIELVCSYIGIVTPILRSSELDKNPILKGQDRIIAICKVLNADCYINPAGGRSLYSQDVFNQESIELFFLDPLLEKISYKQFNNNFVNNLSIVDIMMFNDIQTIRNYLNMYQLNKI